MSIKISALKSKVNACDEIFTLTTNDANIVRSDIGVIQDDCVATLFLIVGLPGAGKTTRAKELAAKHRALRLTPDEWMIPLFGDSMADGKRFTLEGRLISVALQVLRLGT